MNLNEIMKIETYQILQEILQRNSKLLPLENEIKKAANLIVESYKNSGKLLVCGNGGSSSDADHIVGELMKSFLLKRPLDSVLKSKIKEISSHRGNLLADWLQHGLPAISLAAHNSLITAISNDINGDVIFAQQVIGYGNPGDVLLAISSSGNSQNVIDALIVSKAKGLATIGLTGETGGRMKEFCDVMINVPEKTAAYVQELHLPVYHALCLIIESELFQFEK